MVSEPGWKQAMQNEITALEQTGTWQIVDLPPTVKPIGCRWILASKSSTMLMDP
jgi:hypothetical protein